MARADTRSSRRAGPKLGSESGSNVLDFDGSIDRQYETLKCAAGPFV